MAHPDWPSASDLDAPRYGARLRLLDELTKPDTIGFACHFGDQPFGRSGDERGRTRVATRADDRARASAAHVHVSLDHG
jgi:hypothetical protein